MQSALDIFLESGFEKARVEDIAQRAGFTKTMVYYHFSSKENMMSEIIARTLGDVREKFKATLSGLDIDDRQNVRNRIEIMQEYFYRNREVMRLIASEIFRSESTNAWPLSLYDDLFKEISAIFAGDIGEASNRDRALIKTFFFNSLPMIMYASLSDRFNGDMRIDPEESRQIFIDTFIDVLYRDTASDP